MDLAFRNGRLLTDAGIETGRTLRVRDGRIVAVAETHIPEGEVIDLDGQLLAPGFIDTQVNGGGGVWFNEHPDVDGIAAIGRAHRPFGTTGFLPTLISDDLRIVERGIAAVREAIARGVPGVLGIHVEGPFLNPARRGVHDAARLRALDAAAVELLCTPHGGVTVVTLAPELATPELIRALDRGGVVVSAGHTDANYRQVQDALQRGLRGFTHLFNAMSGLGSREPGVVGAALGSDAWCGIIVDGHHVHPATLRLALRAGRLDRFMLVTDAMPSVGSELREFEIHGRRVTVHGDRIVDDEGRLAGAHLDMAGAVRHAVDLLGLDLATALRMASTQPAEFLRLRDLGRLAPGQRAHLVLLDAQLQVRRTWIDGRED